MNTTRRNAIGFWVAALVWPLILLSVQVSAQDAAPDVIVPNVVTLDLTQLGWPGAAVIIAWLVVREGVRITVTHKSEGST